MKHLRKSSGKLNSTGVWKGFGFFQPYKAAKGDAHNVVKFVFGLKFHSKFFIMIMNVSQVKI